MKFRKVAIWLMLLSLWGGSMIFANASSQKVRVMINSAELEDGGLIIEGRTYLPLRQVANAFGAIIDWDNASRRATVYKPNVHMFVYNDKNSPFGVVDRGYQGKIKVFTQVDNLQKDISAFKVTITDPNGNERLIQSENQPNTSDNFWFVTNLFDYRFDSVGNYSIQFHMKVADTDEWSAVSEKLVMSRVPSRN